MKKKKKQITLDEAINLLSKEGAQCSPLNENSFIIFYTRITFETLESNSNLFQPTTQKIKIFIPSYFIITTDNNLHKENNLSTTIFNINLKEIFEPNFVNEEIIDFFKNYIF